MAGCKGNASLEKWILLETGSGIGEEAVTSAMIGWKLKANGHVS